MDLEDQEGLVGQVVLEVQEDLLENLVEEANQVDH